MAVTSPVKDLKTNRVYISSQNHGYVVDTDTLDPNIAKPAFVNVNDGTNEGLAYVGKNIFTVQFHPEACPWTCTRIPVTCLSRVLNMMSEWEENESNAKRQSTLKKY